MATYDESGLRLALPDDKHFRFATLASYIPLSGQHLKEMDFAWLHDNKLVLLELKDYTTTTEALSGHDLVPQKGAANPRRFDDLVTKITDSLLMLVAAWSGTAWGKAVQKELPAELRKPVKLVLAVGLDLPTSLRVHMPGLRIALNDRVRGRLKLVDVESVALLDYDTLLARPTFSPYVTRLAPAVPATT
jgi:hypothetical protein